MLSPHIGDLSTSKAIGAHEQAIAAFSDLYRNLPARVAHDAHPDYRSTQLAQAKRVNCLSVQHHYAHALACMADNRIQAPCFAVVWDGTGYGEDGTVWGGEFLQITPEGYQRLLHFLPFPLPGGMRRFLSHADRHWGFSTHCKPILAACLFQQQCRRFYGKRCTIISIPLKLRVLVDYLMPLLYCSGYAIRINLKERQQCWLNLSRCNRIIN